MMLSMRRDKFLDTFRNNIFRLLVYHYCNPCNPCYSYNLYMLGKDHMIPMQQEFKCIGTLTRQVHQACLKAGSLNINKEPTQYCQSTFKEDVRDVVNQGFVVQ